MIRIIILLTCITILSGCSTWRGIPSHGGGKRFDEEQRVVACAIRKAIADMNVNELRGLKVQVNIEAMAQNGGGQLLLPGIDSISTGYNNFETNDKSNSLQIQEGWNAGVTISTDAELRPTVFTTEGDLKYFEAALNMKLLHSGVNFTAKNPDCILYVLVDVLGTGFCADGFVPDAFRSYLLVSRDIRLFGLVPVGLGIQGRCDLFACEDERAEKR